MKNKILISVLLITTLLLSSCGVVTKTIVKNVKNSDYSLSDLEDGIIKENEGYTVKENINVENNTIKKLKINNPVGSIYLSNEDVDKLEIELIKKIDSKNHSDDEKKEILNKIEFIVEEDKENLKLGFINKEIEKIKKEYGFKKINFDIKIKAPKNIELVDIEVNVGELKIENFIGQLDIVANVGTVELNNIESLIDLEVNVGEVTTKDLKLKDNSNIVLNVGDIELNIIELGNLDMEVNIGEQRINVAEEIKYNMIKNGKRPSDFDSKLPTINLEITLGI